MRSGPGEVELYQSVGPVLPDLLGEDLQEGDGVPAHLLAVVGGLMLCSCRTTTSHCRARILARVSAELECSSQLQLDSA